MARIWLHIGMMKTGTSALQEWFATHEEDLLQQGLLYVRVKPNLPASGPLVDAMAKGGDAADAMLASIRSRIEEVQPEDVLISAESFSVHGPQVAGPLFAALAGHQFRILVWLRRQDRYAEAVYKQTVKWNGASSNPDMVLRRIALQLNYEQLLMKWQEVWPQAEIIPRIYDEATPGQVPDSIADMLGVMGRAGLVPRESAGHRRNVSPCAELVTHYTGIARDNARALRRANRKLMNELGEAAAGRGDLLPQAQSKRILDRFAASNERLRIRWFPERETLFCEEAAVDALRTDSAELLERFDQLFRREGGKD